MSSVDRFLARTARETALNDLTLTTGRWFA
ncbi:MAG: hypothetical protein ACI8XM_001165 [Haloarculaceae archaeon]|jgi:hypothetical protein